MGFKRRTRVLPVGVAGTDGVQRWDSENHLTAAERQRGSRSHCGSNACAVLNSAPLLLGADTQVALEEGTAVVKKVRMHMALLSLRKILSPLRLFMDWYITAAVPVPAQIFSAVPIARDG